ncbi:MAG: hypothetical protein JXR77_13020 [Lentisphaeria bacterium]|nr:hypothetical protein [Lentisphaeria bacterium]
MTDRPCPYAAGRSPGRPAVVLCLTALCLFLASTHAAPAPQAPADNRAPRTTQSADGKEAAKPKPMTPRQAVEQVVRILANQKTPAALYGYYTHIFQEFAARERQRKVTTRQAAALRDKMVQHLQAMGDLLRQMGERARVRDDIRRGVSSVPFHERQNAFSKAGIEHKELLSQFARMGAVLPATYAPPAAPAAPAAP